MKQTAVEWLKDTLESFGNKHELLMSWGTLDELIEQAKEMERQQIIDAHCHNRCMNNQTYECATRAFEDAKQYYKQTHESTGAA